MLHTSLELNENFSTFNGKDLLIHIPNVLLKESLILGQAKEVSMAEVDCKIKVRGLVSLFVTIKQSGGVVDNPMST